MKKKRSKARSIISSIIYIVIISLLVVLLVHVVSAKMKGKVPMVFGYSVMRIVSNSMEDAIPTGTYILVREAKAEEVREGDVITFYSIDPAIYNQPNTHRVMEIKTDEDGAISFVTRGDHNLKNDDYEVTGDKVIGIYCRNLVVLTAIAGFFMTKFMLIVIILVQALIIIMVVTTIVKGRREKNESEKEAQEQPQEEEKPADLSEEDQKKIDELVRQMKENGETSEQAPAQEPGEESEKESEKE